MNTLRDARFPTPVEAIAHLINELEALQLVAEGAIDGLKAEDIKADVAMVRENVRAAIEVAQLAEARLAAAVARHAAIEAEARLDSLLYVMGIESAAAAD
jgi:hypothetical protein